MAVMWLMLGLLWLSLHLVLVQHGLVFDTGDAVQLLHGVDGYEAFVLMGLSLLLVADILFLKHFLVFFDFLKSLVARFRLLLQRRPVQLTKYSLPRSAHLSRAPPQVS